jgi:hypothetical protein
VTTKTLGASKPWTMSASAYLAAIGVHEPWIAEISPWQYSTMSKAGKARYDKQRREEWVASGEAKGQWLSLCMAAYDAGTITLDSPDLHEEAKDRIKGQLLKRRKEQAEAQHQERLRQNRITSLDDVNVGDRVFDIMVRGYGRITRKYKTSVHLELERPIYEGRTTIKSGLGQFQWLAYNDVN